MLESQRQRKCSFIALSALRYFCARSDSRLDPQPLLDWEWLCLRFQIPYLLISVSVSRRPFDVTVSFADPLLLIPVFPLYVLLGYKSSTEMWLGVHTTLNANSLVKRAIGIFRRSESWVSSGRRPCFYLIVHHTCLFSPSSFQHCSLSLSGVCIDTLVDIYIRPLVLDNRDFHLSDHLPT